MENLPIETPPQGMANKENDVGDDYYFQDPTTIGTHHNQAFIHVMIIQEPTFPTVPGFTPIPVEKFPEYVQDMISNNENKLQEEFMVRTHLCGCGRGIIAFYVPVYRHYQDYPSHPVQWLFYHTTTTTTDSTTFIHVSAPSASTCMLIS